MLTVTDSGYNVELIGKLSLLTASRPLQVGRGRWPGG